MCTGGGSNVILRALLDSGSQISFIHEAAFRGLDLPKEPCDTKVVGIGASRTCAVRGQANLVLLLGTDTPDSISVTVLVLQKITGFLPSREIIISPQSVLHLVELADKTFNIPAEVDMLLGADVFHDVVLAGQIKAEEGFTLLETRCGWAVSGPYTESITPNLVSLMSVSTEQKTNLDRFWELEEVIMCKDEHPSLRCKTQEELLVELHFTETTKTDEDGRKVVCLPFKPGSKPLGNSFATCTQRFLYTEKKLSSTPQVYGQYREFMAEFRELAHMELVPANELNIPSDQCYYIPHHHVTKEDSTTTKLRVVFDASAKSSNGISLNEQLMVGPKRQDDLFHIILRYRFHRVALSGDITKMYRQVKLSATAKDFHRVLWRDVPGEDIKIYRMTRVTYGITSASHHSVRALQESSENTNCSKTKEVILRDFYVDDLLTGSPTLQEAKQLRRSISETLLKSGFEIRKWACNIASLVNELPEKLRENVEAFEIGNDDHNIKTLGIAWYPLKDVFFFKVLHLDTYPESSKDLKKKERAANRQKKLDEENIRLILLKPEEPLPTHKHSRTSSRELTLSKRAIASDIAKIFDPVGFLGPVTIRLKICLQQVWKSGLGWDEDLPSDLALPFLQWRNMLPGIRGLEIPRCILAPATTGLIQLHVFCDASEYAYGAAVYTRIVDVNGTVKVSFLTSKTKVAPLKMTQSIPRLELSAAVTGVRLINAVLVAINRLDLQPEIFGWSDSTTVLNWLNSLPGRWQTFVANRVCEIQETLPRSRWFHIGTGDNPADCASRGITVEELKDHLIWWTGPKFLSLKTIVFPRQPTEESSEEKKEEKLVKPLAVATLTITAGHEPAIGPLDLRNYSSIRKATAVLSYVVRFCDILRKKVPKPQPRYVTVGERSNALRLMVKAYQEIYESDMTCIKNKEQVGVNSKLKKLYPFIDDEGILRVGGRLAQSQTIPDEMKFPAILPKNCRLAELLARQVHVDTMHGGLQLCIAELRRNFWVISSRALFKELLRDCVTCFAFNSKQARPLMGDLPEVRIKPSPPFTHTGLDFAGPFFTSTPGRGKTDKSYLAVFVCFSTKAIHLEVVSSLTTGSCILALRRFAARRGAPEALYSDNGTNFTGARTELVKLRAELDQKTGSFPTLAAELGTSWKMIPPGSPHFGGLWEAAVKSAKLHLKKIMGKEILTFEELSTLACDIEAILNSRPLVPASDDPNDLEALTPNMLLTGKSVRYIPLQDPKPLATMKKFAKNPLKRWLHIQNFAAHFWRRWTKEYLSTLQLRNKWTRELPNINPGDIVLLTDEKSSPLHWPLARVIQTYPGNDKVTRTVQIKTAKGVYDRPTHKLRKLPICQETDTEDTPTEDLVAGPSAPL